MFFSGFLCRSNYDRKKGTVIWPLVRMFGGSMSLDCFGRFLDQITTGKIKGTVIWPLVAMFGGLVPCARIVLTGSLLCFFAGSLIKLQITTRKKVQSSGHWLQCLGGQFHELGLFWRVRRYVFWWVPQSNYKLPPEKRYSCLAIGWNVYYVLLTYYTLVDRPSDMTLWEISW